MSPVSPVTNVTSASNDPVSLVIRRKIRRGSEEAYEQALKEGAALIAKVPGHRGTGILRPPAGDLNYTLLIRFESLQSAQTWENSQERSAWLQQIAPLVDEVVSFGHQPGLDFWFTPPGALNLRQPPRWKMAVLTMLALYPVSLGMTEFLGALRLEWPLPVRTLVQVVCVVILMTYLVMPVITRLASRWLQP